MKPEAQAERLLWEVLPKDLYFHYAAFGWFSIPVNGRKYYLYKNIKTQSVDQDGTHLSWCIHSSRKVPDQDRLVSEYLLLTNNEAEYLRTANGTVVGEPALTVGRAPIDWQGHVINALITIAGLMLAVSIVALWLSGGSFSLSDRLSVPALPLIASPSHDPHMITAFMAYQELYRRGDLAEKPPEHRALADETIVYGSGRPTVTLPALHYPTTIQMEGPASFVTPKAAGAYIMRGGQWTTPNVMECPERQICTLTEGNAVFAGFTTATITTSVAWASAGVTTFGTEVH